MLIAFEGPDKTGKTSSAAAISADGVGIYNARKDVHEIMRKTLAENPGLPITYDRIDWLTHMIYRLALPEYEWNDPRVRTVFAMPDTHLVFKVHGVVLPTDELYNDEQLIRVNTMYRKWAELLMVLNHQMDYTLFRSVTVMEVRNSPSSGFRQHLVSHDSAGLHYGSSFEKLVDSDERLLEFLIHVEQHSG